jgi:hypothetical protein
MLHSNKEKPKDVNKYMVALSFLFFLFPLGHKIENSIAIE